MPQLSLRVARIEYIHPFHRLFNANVDILIHLDDGRCFSATVFTLENIAAIMARHQESVESAGGLYFWTLDMIIARQLDRGSIESSIRHIIEEEGYLASFEQILPTD